MSDSKCPYCLVDGKELEAEITRHRELEGRYKQALEAIWFGSLEANFKQCLQTPQEIAEAALEGKGER